MRTKASIVLGSLGLSALLVLTGCTSTPKDDVKIEPTPSATAVAPAPSEMPVDGAPNQAPFQADLPETLQAIFGGLTGRWIYQVGDVQTIALSDSYDSEMLQAFVNNKLTEGWTLALPTSINDDGLVAGLVNEAGDSITIVGLISGAMDSDGGNSAPASVITYKKA